MIDYINVQLNLWAAWLLTADRHGLGFPHQSAFARLSVSKGSGGGGAGLPDEEAMFISRVVAHLPEEQRKVVDRFYVHCRNTPVSYMARDFGVSEDTIYRRLHRAHLTIMEALNDRAAGVVPSWQSTIEPGNWVSSI